MFMRMPLSWHSPMHSDWRVRVNLPPFGAIWRGLVMACASVSEKSRTTTIGLVGITILVVILEFAGGCLSEDRSRS